MYDVQIGIAASAGTEGVAPTSGMPATPGASTAGGATIVNANPTVKRAVIVWGVALGVLFLFHVGGAHLG